VKLSELGDVSVKQTEKRWTYSAYSIDCKSIRKFELFMNSNLACVWSFAIVRPILNQH